MDQPRTDSVLQSWPTHVAIAVATGVVTTYLPVHRWSRGARWGLHGGTAATAACAVAYAVRRPRTPSRTGGGSRVAAPAEESTVPREPLGWARTAAVAGAVGGVALAVSRGSQAADEWAERALVRRGVRRPRVWMGVVAAAASLVWSISDDRRASSEAPDDPEAS